MNKKKKKIEYPRGTKLLDVRELAGLLDMKANEEAGIDLTKLTYKHTEPVFFKCPDCGTTYPTSPFLKTQGAGCGFCKKNQINETNCVLIEFPEIVKYWDWDLNTMELTKISSGTDKEAWFICHLCGRRYPISVRRWCKMEIPCKYCRDHTTRILPFDETFAGQYPELVKDWDFSKNEINPSRITKNYSKNVYWRCHKCGTGWEARVDMRVLGLRLCPKCSKEKE